MHQTSHYITTLLKHYSAHYASTTAHGKYTHASTWLRVVACWKYVESIWKKYFEWSIWTNTSTDKKVFKIPKYQILNVQYFKYQIPNTKSISNTYLKYKYFIYCPPLRISVLPWYDMYVGYSNKLALSITHRELPRHRGRPRQERNWFKEIFHLRQWFHHVPQFCFYLPLDGFRVKMEPVNYSV